MTLISILLALALEYFLGSMDRFRNFRWFESYLQWLELRAQRFSLWDGTVGVITTVGLPVLAMLSLDYVLAEIFIGLSFILSILVFVYCLGPDLNILLSNYTQSLEGNIEEDISVIESDLQINSGDVRYDGSVAIKAILTRAHEYIFGVLFWFIILGISGALIFALTLALKRRYEGVHGGYSEGVNDLYGILIWPSSRLLAIGFALSGSLVDTLERWRSVEGDSLNCSQDIVTESGMGALQFQPGSTDDEEEAQASYIQVVKETQALINRSLVIWLTILGLLTLGGILN